MTKYAIGRGVNFRLDSKDGNLIIYRQTANKIYQRTLENVLSKESLIGFGNELTSITHDKNLVRTNSVLEII